MMMSRCCRYCRDVPTIVYGHPYIREMLLVSDSVPLPSDYCRRRHHGHYLPVILVIIRMLPVVGKFSIGVIPSRTYDSYTVPVGGYGIYDRDCTNSGTMVHPYVH